MNIVDKIEVCTSGNHMLSCNCNWFDVVKKPKSKQDSAQKFAEFGWVIENERLRCRHCAKAK